MIITVNENFKYKKEDVRIVLDELFEASYVYVGKKEKDLFFSIIVNLMNEERAEQYEIDMWYDFSIDGKFKDLCLLAKIWRDIAKLLRPGNESDILVGTATIKDMVRLVEKLKFNKYTNS